MRSRAGLERTGGSSRSGEFQYAILPSSMPMSVTSPVMCVVRISARDSLVMSAFCSPMMKLSSITVSGTNRPATWDSRSPSAPKPSSSKASTISGSANSLCRCRRRAKLTMMALQAAPPMKDSSAPKPAR